MAKGNKAKRAATRAATIALATSGLSSCGDGSGGVVDPAPSPLQCDRLLGGGNLSATVNRSGDTLTVNLRPTAEVRAWLVTRVSEVTGATVISASLPRSGSLETAVLVMKLNSPSVTQAAFTLEGQYIGHVNEVCIYRRQFTVTITAGGVQIAQADGDLLPLPSRYSAELVLADRDGQTVTLDVRTRFRGEFGVAWNISGGVLLDDPAAHTVRWMLPNGPGIYQAQVAVDFGLEGVAFDALTLEVG